MNRCANAVPFGARWAAEIREALARKKDELVWNPLIMEYVPASALGSETQSEAWRD
jgi:hypothetical protein